MSAHDRQVGGHHYKDMAIQPSDFITKNGLSWNCGNAVKYICRHKAKNGREDLEKAIHYLELEIESVYPSTTKEVNNENPILGHREHTQHSSSLPNPERVGPPYSNCQASSSSMLERQVGWEGHNYISFDSRGSSFVY